MSQGLPLCRPCFALEFISVRRLGFLRALHFGPGALRIRGKYKIEGERPGGRWLHSYAAAHFDWTEWELAGSEALLSLTFCLLIARRPSERVFFGLCVYVCARASAVCIRRGYVRVCRGKIGSSHFV